jgi:FkbM family methyltransferase
MIRSAVRFARTHYREASGKWPRLPVTADSRPKVRLGSDYGGWTFLDLPELRGSTIISGGLGEDASFDIPFADRYGARVVMVDPTPRAAAFFAASVPQDGRFVLHRRALWKADEPVTLFPPVDPRHVSWSVAGHGERLTVDGITIRTLVAEHGLPPLVKLDIECSEIETLTAMLADSIRPTQVLVEYDELLKPARAAADKVASAHAMMLANGYALVHRDYPANFLYVRPQGLG